ncbi:hypothetical protein J4558_07080 [Leptolyngbya sp. 15MV]|nr:hypothetical protein J4558_07080 [Leptolyngbya sp. 15MV]
MVSVASSRCGDKCGVGQLDLRDALLPRRGEEDQREAALLAVEPAHLLESNQPEERHGRLGIGDADHAVEIFHHRAVPIQKRFIDKNTQLIAWSLAGG